MQQEAQRKITATPPLPEVGISLQRSGNADEPLLDRLERHVLDSFLANPGLAVAA